MSIVYSPRPEKLKLSEVRYAGGIQKVCVLAALEGGIGDVQMLKSGQFPYRFVAASEAYHKGGRARARCLTPK